MAAACEVPAAFEREQGCTETEWLRWLPGAVGGPALERPAPGRARVAVGAGCLHLAWTTLPPRRIALMRLPRLAVEFRFEEVSPGERREFMRHFDLYLHRGGG